MFKLAELPGHMAPEARCFEGIPLHGDYPEVDSVKKTPFGTVLALAFCSAASMASTGPYATQWALLGPYDVDLIEGNDTNLAFSPVTGEPVVIGLIDTGIDYRRADLAGAVWTNSDEIAGNCVDDDGNGYIDDMHGIRVDVDRFDDLLHGSEGDLIGALGEACAEHGGMLSGTLCEAGDTSDALDESAIAGLNAAYPRAATAMDGNPLLYSRSCLDGYGATRGERIELARGDALDYWYGHGTQMAGTMAARSGVSGEPASLLDLPKAGGGKLGDYVKIVTCAAGFPGDVSTTDPFIMPRGTVDGAVECIDYFLELKARGVNLVVVNLSHGMAKAFPMFGTLDVPIVDDALGDASNPDVVAAFDRLEAADVVVVAAAHNQFRDIDDAPEHAMYPAAFEHDNIVRVGGINERGVWFGNRGRHTVDVAAPAQAIRHPAVSADLAMMARLARDDVRELGATGDVPFDFVSFGEGTSQATAYMSTVVALLRANATTAQLSAPAIRRLILAAATPLPSIPWMWILRPAGNPDLQAAYWYYLGMFEPTTRTLKQQQLSQNSRSGRIARLDRALACQGLGFQRLVSPVQRQAVAAGGTLRVEAESYVCAQPSTASSLSATVKRPDGLTQTLTLTAQGGGYYAASYVPAMPGSHAFALTSAPTDVLTLAVPSP